MSRYYQPNQQNQNLNSNMNARQNSSNINKEMKTEYNLPGVLHFLQAEYRSFERERNEWSIQLAELKAKVISLEGEKRAVEGIKNDLLRRVKMLEYALRQERGKYLSKQQNFDMDKSANVVQPSSEEVKVLPQVNLLKKAVTSRPNSLNSQKNKFRKDKCREVLKMCLVELNTIPLPTELPTRSNRSSFDRGDEMPHKHSKYGQGLPETDDSLKESKREVQPYNNGQKPSLSIDITKDSIANPLTYSPIYTDFKEGSSNTTNSKALSTEPKSEPSITEAKPIPRPRPRSNLASGLSDEEKRKNRITVIAPDDYQGELYDDMAQKSSPFNPTASTSRSSGKNLKDAVNEVAKEMSHKDISNASLSRASANRLGSIFKALGREQDDDTDFSTEIGFSNPDATLLGTKGLREDFNLNASMQNLSLDLADLQHGMQEPTSSQSNVPDKFTDQSNLNTWKPKLTLKSHLDSVRSLSFHDTNMILASGSDDGTVKLWKLQTLSTLTKKSLRQDFEPWFIYRGHTANVTSVAMYSQRSCLYSSSFDFTIKKWKLPESERVVQDPTEPKLLETTLIGHTDIVWNIKLSPLANRPNPKEKVLLASTSADGFVKLWDTDPATISPLVSSFTYNTSKSNAVNGTAKRTVPTAVDFLHSDASKLLVSYRNSTIQLVDINTSQVITQYNSDETYDGTAATQINCIVSHPTIPLVVSGHEDRYIRFFDVNSGACAHSMVAHLDSISALDINSSGLSLVSGGHDASIRWWDLTSYACVQEFSSHRSKSDEAVYHLKFHPTQNWLASSGADSAIKLFTV